MDKTLLIGAGGQPGTGDPRTKCPNKNEFLTLIQTQRQTNRVMKFPTPLGKGGHKPHLCSHSPGAGGRGELRLKAHYRQSVRPVDGAWKTGRCPLSSSLNTTSCTSPQPWGLQRAKPRAQPGRYERWHRADAHATGLPRTHLTRPQEGSRQPAATKPLPRARSCAGACNLSLSPGASSPQFEDEGTRALGGR